MHYTHLRHGTQPCSWRKGGVADQALCGDGSLVSDAYTIDPDLVDCPKCSSKWATAEIKKLPADRAPSLVAAPSRRFRSAYDLFINGQHYGQITLDTGKRSRWVVRDHSGDLLPETEEKVRRGFYFGRRSKEHAALDAVERLDILSTREQYESAQAVEARQMAGLRAKAREKRDHRKADNAFAIEEINTMIETMVLTNSQRAALGISLIALGDVQEMEG
jgi:hypothetical protein